MEPFSFLYAVRQHSTGHVQSTFRSKKKTMCLTEDGSDAYVTRRCSVVDTYGGVLHTVTWSGEMMKYGKDLFN